MDVFRIEGAGRLAGAIAPMGNKNSALPLLAASVLTNQSLEIGNVPDIGDVRSKLALLDSLARMFRLRASISPTEILLPTPFLPPFHSIFSPFIRPRFPVKSST